MAPRAVIISILVVGALTACENAPRSGTDERGGGSPQVLGAQRPATAAAWQPARSPEENTRVAQRLREAYSRPPEQWPTPTIDPGVEYVELGLLRKPPFPPDNPFTEAKAELGKTLFFDPRLSGSGAIACASCHEPELGWSDGRAVSFGHARSPNARNAPTLINIAHRESLFWDGRAATLEEQALAPIAAENEMNADADTVVKRLNEQPGYRSAFRESFGDEVVSMERIAAALATYQRTIVSRPSAFDKFLAGQKHALSDAAVRGLHLFRTDARCVNCHMGPTFSDEQFHDLGLSYFGRRLEDLGRYEVTHDPKDVGRFKTPTLRNITRTAPYMHNGLFDLAGVLRMYNAGMATLRRKPEQLNDPLFPTKSSHLRRLGLNDGELGDLRALLESLEETRLRVRPPELPGLSVSEAFEAGTAPP